MIGSICYTFLPSAAYRGDKHQLILLMQHRCRRDVAAIDCALAAFYHWLQSWVTCKQRGLYIRNGRTLRHRQYFLAQSYNFFKGGEITYMYLHRKFYDILYGRCSDLLLMLLDGRSAGTFAVA